MSYVLRILAGALSGVEYDVSDGETLFHVGRQEDLANGRAAQLLGADERAYFIPADLPTAAFVVMAPSTEEALQLGERVDASAAWTWRTLPLQQPLQAAGIHFAVRAQHAAWSEAVLAFVPPAFLIECAAAAMPPASSARRRLGPFVLFGIGVLLVAGMLAAWFHWLHQPEIRVRGLASVLSNAPADYVVAAGNDGHLYAFSETASARTWGERASRRAQRRNDVHLLRRVEAIRLEDALISAGMDLVVVRLDDPVRPEVVLSGPLTAARTAQVNSLLGAQAPYVKLARVSAISDQQLVALAQQQLRVLGISSRAEPRGQRVSIVNDVFLDDAGLNAMGGAARRFHQRWGKRRISLSPRLWDDLLQGRSYRYSRDQLLSVGSGRWDYSRAAGSQAAP